MVNNEELLECCRRIWSATTAQAIRDYQAAWLYGDERGWAVTPGKKVFDAKSIGHELTEMGYGAYLKKIKDAALRVRRFVDDKAKSIEDEIEFFDCPGCGAKDALRLFRGKRRICARCSSCDIAYITWVAAKPKERRKP